MKKNKLLLIIIILSIIIVCIFQICEKDKNSCIRGTKILLKKDIPKEYISDLYYGNNTIIWTKYDNNSIHTFNIIKLNEEIIIKSENFIEACDVLNNNIVIREYNSTNGLFYLYTYDLLNKSVEYIYNSTFEINYVCTSEKFILWHIRTYDISYIHTYNIIEKTIIRHSIYNNIEAIDITDTYFAYSEGNSLLTLIYLNSNETISMPYENIFYIKCMNNKIILFQYYNGNNKILIYDIFSSNDYIIFEYEGLISDIEFEKEKLFLLVLEEEYYEKEFIIINIENNNKCTITTNKSIVSIAVSENNIAILQRDHIEWGEIILLYI